MPGPTITGPYATQLWNYFLAHDIEWLDPIDLGDWIKSWWRPGMDSSPVLYDMLERYEVPRATINAAFARAGLPVPVGSRAMDIVRNPVVQLLATASGALSFYHGYKRNVRSNPFLWGLWWAAVGTFVAPVLTPTYGFAQGFAKPKGAALSGARYRRRKFLR